MDGGGRKTVYLIGGGLGIPPLLFAARRLKQALHGRVAVEAFLGFPGDPWYTEAFSERCDGMHVASEREGAAADLCGNVVDLLNAVETEDAPALALSCGPKPMLEAVSSWCASRDIGVRVSLEERMGCGYGACFGCTCRVRSGGEKSPDGARANETGHVPKKKICVHGPVFWGDEVVWESL